MEVWLQKSNGDGSWSEVSGDDAWQYFKVATPNPGPSSAKTFTWNYGQLQLPPNTDFRVFGYVYIYNQGGGNQGVFPLYSTLGNINSGAANDSPRAVFPTDRPRINPTQATVGKSYSIKADGYDDNGNLGFIIVWKDGVPFANNPTGSSANSYYASAANDSIEPTPGTVTYTALAQDYYDATSAVETWTVTILDRDDQPGVGSINATINLGQSFTPTYLGGAGFGGWQFVVAGNTNFDASTSNNTGTISPNGTWSPSWTPTSGGTYSFYVTRNGDGDYKPSGIAGPYTLTVIGPVVADTPPSASIYATSTMMTVGQTPMIYANFLDGSGLGVLTSTNIDSPAGNPLPGQDGTRALSRSYSFTPTAAGTSTFAAQGYSLLNGLKTLATVNVTVIATANTSPTASIYATLNTIAVGQAVMIYASFADGGGSGYLTGTNIDSPAGNALPGQDGTRSLVRSYGFTPTAAGTYTFAARGASALNGWQTLASVSVTVVNSGYPPLKVRIVAPANAEKSGQGYIVR